MSYGVATTKDLPALTALWQVCFGDSPEEIQTFWRCLFDKLRVFVAREDKTPVSMLCALPVALIDEMGESLPAAYLYAVCTAPEHRGKGLCRGLMTYAEQALRKEGCRYVALSPASDGLFRFYEGLGYRTALYHREYTVAAGGRVKITPLDTEAYLGLRELFLRGAYVSYDAPLLDWLQSFGKLYRVEIRSAVCCAAVQKRGDRLFCMELLPDEPTAAAALAAALGCSEAFVRSEGAERPFGMLKALDGSPIPKSAYLGFAFD